MITASLRWLPLSLALHSAAVAAALLLPRDSTLLPLFVDLTLVEPITSTGRLSASPDSAAPPRGQRAMEPGRAASVPAAPSRATVSPPAAPAPAPPVAPPEPDATPQATPAIPSALEPPAVAASAEAPVAPSPSPAPVATSTPNGTATRSTAEPTNAGSVSSGVAGAGGVGETPVGPAAPGRDAGDGPTGAGAGGGGDALALGVAGDEGGVYAGYIALLRRRVQEALTYPAAARRRGMSGTVHLDISVEPTGRIADVLVVRSSSHDVLDAAALDAVRTLRQVPFPPGVRPRAVRVRLPVVFELR